MKIYEYDLIEACEKNQININTGIFYDIKFIIENYPTLPEKDRIATVLLLYKALGKAIIEDMLPRAKKVHSLREQKESIEKQLINLSK